MRSFGRKTVSFGPLLRSPAHRRSEGRRAIADAEIRWPAHGPAVPRHRRGSSPGHGSAIRIGGTRYCWRRQHRIGPDLHSRIAAGIVAARKSETCDANRNDSGEARQFVRLICNSSSASPRVKGKGPACGDRIHQQNGDDDYGERHARRYHRGIAIAAMDQDVHERNQDGGHITERPEPGRPLLAKAPDRSRRR